MAVTLGFEQDVFHVKVIEIDSKPAVKMPNFGIAGTAAIVKYVEVVQGEIVPGKSPASNPTQTPKAIDIIDAEIIETPQGKPTKTTTSQHFGMKTGSTFLEMHRANAQAEQGRAIGVVIGGTAIGIIDAFTNKETTLISNDAQSYSLKGSYQVGKNIGNWAKDRTRDARNLFKDLISKDENKPINWPDILPYQYPEIPFSNFEPNFEDIDPDFNFDDYKKRKPDKKRHSQNNSNNNQNQNINSGTNVSIPDDYSGVRPFDPIPQIPGGNLPIGFDPVLGPYDLDFIYSFGGQSRSYYPLNDRWSRYGEGYSIAYFPFVGAFYQIEVDGVLRAIARREAIGWLKYDENGVSDDSGPIFDWPKMEGSEITEYHHTGYLISWYKSIWYLDFMLVRPHPPEGDPEKEDPPPSVKNKEKKVNVCLFDEEKIKKIIRSLKAKIEIPIVEAEKKEINGVEKWIPKINRTQVEVIAIDENTAASVALIYRKIAEIQIDLIKMRNQEPPIAVIPEWWQTRIGSNRPQLIAVYAEKLPNGKLGRTRWPISIPHYNEAIKKPQLPAYTKGQWEGILTLKDNSKLVINAISQADADSMLRQLSKFIKPEMLQGAASKVGIRKGPKLKECRVVATSVRFFSTGQKDTTPDWVNSLI